MEKELQYPFNAEVILRKKKTLKRVLLEKTSFIEKRIAILGGSTTEEIKNILELFLLDVGIRPVFYESEYNKYYEDSIFENHNLQSFKPDFIYLHITIENIKNFPEMADTEEDVNYKIAQEFSTLKNIWETLYKKYAAIIIQNNFALPFTRNFGNIDSVNIHGSSYFIAMLNHKILNYIQKHTYMCLNDLQYLSAKIGLDNWYDRNFWYAYKVSLSQIAIPELSYNIASIIKASLGKSKKCLVLDLDNTLWGGVIGDDGINGIKIGKETPQAEAFTEFQQYVLSLKNRGVILAVCSKNDLDNAKQGFSHPDSILKYEDFISFKANWQEKYLNILEIAKEINIGLDSMVFIDDNPVERERVANNLPEVSVLAIDENDISSYAKMIDRSGFFDLVQLSQDDLQRNLSYKRNKIMLESQTKFTSYLEFLESLEMQAEIKEFQPIYFDRIAQLTNKTNQFNLTTKRYTVADIQRFREDERYITLYGRLKDKFNDNGIVSVVIGRKETDVLHIDLWLMSCRVLKRNFEYAMFKVLKEDAKRKAIKQIKGYYFKTEKNKMVSEHYLALGFDLLNKNGEDTVWLFDLETKDDNVESKFIKILDEKG